MAVFGCLWSCLTWPIVCLALVAAYIIYMSWNFKTFRSQGIPGDTPIPGIGTAFTMFFKSGFWEYDKEMNKKYGDSKFYTEDFGRMSILMTRDPDFLKEVFIKRIEDFPTRNAFITGDKYANAMLSNITDYDHWKMMRSIMSPAFSSGKLKRMMKQINVCASQCVNHMGKAAEKDAAMELKEYSGSFTMDVIASTAFGLDLNTKDDHNNQFVKYAKEAFTFSLKSPVVLIVFFFPMLMPVVRALKMGIFNTDIINFFAKVTVETLKNRKDDMARSDFLQLMMNAHKDDHSEDKEELEEVEGVALKPQRGMTKDELISQAILFFLAGYDTTATTISFLAYNLALNPEKQDKLIAEIDEVLGDKVELTTDDFNNMPYLDMCVSESLRMYPPAIRTDRKAARDVVVQGIKIPKDALVGVSIRMIHYDPKIWPDPETFIPERFTQEAKSERGPFAYMPFGLGPRMCIATRLALMEVKMFTAHVLMKYRYERSAETEVPIKMGKTGLLKAQNGIWLKLKNRKQD